MTIYTISTTTFDTGINVSIRKTVANENAIVLTIERAFERFKSKVTEQPRFINHILRVCIFEQVADECGIGLFVTVKRTYRDYKLIDGEMKMVNEIIKTE